MSTAPPPTGTINPLTGIGTFFKDIGAVVHVAEDAAKLSLGDYLLIFFGVVLVIMAIASYNKRPVTNITNVISKMPKSGGAVAEAAPAAPSIAEAALAA